MSSKADKKDSLESPHKEKQETREVPKGRKGKLTYSQQREIQSLEQDIGQLEERKQELEALFTNPDLPGEELNDLSREMSELVKELEEKTGRWFELSAIEET